MLNCCSALSHCQLLNWNSFIPKCIWTGWAAHSGHSQHQSVFDNQQLPTNAALFLQPLSLSPHPPSGHLLMSLTAWREVAENNVFWEITFSSYHHSVPRGLSPCLPLLSCTKPIFWLIQYSLSFGHIKRYVATGLAQQMAVHQLAYSHCQEQSQKKFETTKSSYCSIP